MDSSDLELFVSDKLYEDDEVTLYSDFRMDVREDQPVEPESRQTYMQEILSGKRRLLSMGRPRFPSLAVTTLTPILTPSTLTPVLTPVQRISARRKFSSTHRVITHRQKQRLRLEALTKQLRSKMIAEVPTRLQTLETNFSELEKEESEWPPSELPDPKGP